MSYILDALQRAALERERASGTVPGLQTRSIAAPATTQKAGAVMRHRWLLLGLLIVLAIAALSIIVWRASPLSPPQASSSVEAARPPAAPEPSKSVSAPVAVSPAAVTESGSLNPPSPLPAAVRPAPSTAPPSALAAPPASAPASTPVSAPPAPLSASAPKATTATLPFLKDLPEALRAQIPPLSISGVVYSENPAQRLILLNGQVLTQGSRAGEDLVLDEIHPRSSDFTFKGTRFKLSH